MRNLRLLRAAACGSFLVAALIAPAQSASASATCSWTALPNPDVPPSSVLEGIAPISADDVWAVGSYFKPGIPNGSPLLEHWDGTSLEVQYPGPAQAGFEATVTVPGKKQVWTVGWQNGIGARSLIEHLKGDRWRVVPSPMDKDSFLADVAAISARDVWAVGVHYIPGGGHPLTEHWDGHTWSVVRTPALPGSFSPLTSVAEVSSDDVYAVGSTGNEDAASPLIEHWNGRRWSVVTGTDLVGGLTSVSASSARDVWAVGPAGIERFNGSSWTSEALPSGVVFPFGVTAFSPSDTWLVDLAFPSTRGSVSHWNGSSWRRDNTAELPDYSPLYTVAGLSSTDLWAAGATSGATGIEALLAHRTC